MEESLYVPAGRPLVMLTDRLPSRSAAVSTPLKNANFEGSERSVDEAELICSMTKWEWPMMSFPEFNRCGAP